MLITPIVVSYSHMSEETPTPIEQVKTSFTQHTDDVLELQNAAEASRRYQEAQVNAQPSPQSNESGLFQKHPILTTAALVGVAAVGFTGLTSLEGGNSNGSERGTVDTTIESITISPDATFRLDPKVGEGEENNNVLQLGARVTIDVNHDIRVLEDTNNGTWYGISTDEIAAVVPKVSSINDNDGILWINEQGVESVATTELPTE